jgi:hypothetical protein
LCSKGKGKCTYKVDDERPNGIWTFTDGSGPMPGPNGGWELGTHAFKWFEIIVCTWTFVSNGNTLDIWTVITIIQ